MAKIEKMHACRYAECSRTFQNVLECMQNVPEYSRTCKFMDLHAFRNILEHPGTFCMHSGTFCMLSGTFCMYSGTFCMHSRTFWNILHACIFQFWPFWPKLLRFKFAFKFATLVEIWVKCEPVGR